MPAVLRRLVLPLACAGVGALAWWLGAVEGFPVVHWGGGAVAGLAALAAGYALVADRLPGAHGAGITAADRRPLAATRAELAARLGWQVRNSDPSLLHWARDGLLVDGGERRANHVLTGVRRGLRFAVFEYVRRRPGDDGLVGTTVWMVLLREPLPSFELRRPHPGAEWSSRAVDPAAVRPLLTPPVLARLRAGDLLHLQAEGPTLITHRPGFASGGGAQAVVVREAESLLAAAEILIGPARP